MKKNLFTLALWLCAAVPLFAQQNFSIPVVDAEWITVRASGCIGGSTLYNTWREYLGSDTLVQGQTYQKLMLHPECTLQTQGLNCNYFYNAYQGPAVNIGALRVAGQKVYFLKFTLPPPDASVYEADLEKVPGGTDVLLYDFGWSVGDTVVTPKSDGSNIFYKVTDVSLYPSGRKKISLLHLNGIGYTHIVMEGMGNTVGLLGNYSNIAASSYAPLPACFNQNGQFIVDSGECDHCGSVATKPEPLDGVFSVFPNPADQSIVVETGQDSPQNFDLQIVNLLGQVLYRQNDCEGHTTVSCANWPAQPCILLLSDRSGGKLWLKKLQIAH